MGGGETLRLLFFGGRMYLSPVKLWVHTLRKRESVQVPWLNIKCSLWKDLVSRITVPEEMNWEDFRRFIQSEIYDLEEQ